MDKITLGKSERINIYRAESDILFDGHRVGTVEITYAYTQGNKLRVKEYSVEVYKEWVWQTLIGATYRSVTHSDTVKQSFQVDGTWENKHSRRWTGVKTGIETYTSKYKTAKDAKAQAVAWIKDQIKYGIFQ